MAGILDMFDGIGDAFTGMVDKISGDDQEVQAQVQAEEAPKPSIKKVGADGSTTETDWGKRLQGVSQAMMGLNSIINNQDGLGNGIEAGKAIGQGFRGMLGYDDEAKSAEEEPVEESKGVLATTKPDTPKATTTPTIQSEAASVATTPSQTPVLLDETKKPKLTDEEKKYNDFRDRMAQLESSGRKDVVNKLGYSGKYQFGTLALKDMGIIDMDAPNSNKSLQNPKYWKKNKYGVKNLDEFLNSEDAQDKIFEGWNKTLTRQLKSKGADKYLGKTINGVKVTNQGLIAASHMLGAGAVAKALRNGTLDKLKDANNHSALERMREVM